mmetsp:Transcript_46567/g.110712  ORF Transcript_46567/g.110712 Transcript_46567/m.110712 type:complete len:221 (-) Transcript_46567:1442-2104(-)
MVSRVSHADGLVSADPAGRHVSHRIIHAASLQHQANGDLLHGQQVLVLALDVAFLLKGRRKAQNLGELLYSLVGAGALVLQALPGCNQNRGVCSHGIAGKTALHLQLVHKTCHDTRETCKILLLVVGARKLDSFVAHPCTFQELSHAVHWRIAFALHDFLHSTEFLLGSQLGMLLSELHHHGHARPSLPEDHLVTLSVDHLRTHHLHRSLEPLIPKLQGR